MTSLLVGMNVGSDGVTLIPYIPSAEDEAMGDFGPGDFGWYLYSMGFSINVTVTKPTKDSAMHGQAPYMMNVITRGPEMCTSKAEGLCTETAATADAALQAFAEDYLTRRTKADERAEAAEQGVVLKESDVPTLTAHPPLKKQNAMPELASLACPTK